jgi:hypothetical protein
LIWWLDTWLKSSQAQGPELTICLIYFIIFIFHFKSSCIANKFIAYFSPDLRSITTREQSLELAIWRKFSCPWLLGWKVPLGNNSILHLKNLRKCKEYDSDDVICPEPKSYHSILFKSGPSNSQPFFFFSLSFE